MKLVRRIYALVDPATNEVRYIGNTSHKFISRFKALYSSGLHRDLSQWIKDLRENNHAPIMKQLEMSYGRMSFRREAFWISYYATAGHRLFNKNKNPLVPKPRLYRRKSRSHAIPEWRIQIRELRK